MTIDEPRTATDFGEAALDSVHDEADDLVMQIAAQDTEIARLEAALRDLPQLLERLAGHPVLWLLLGRAGVDRPGDDLERLVGQQVVTERRTNWHLMVLVGIVMLLLGMTVGVALAGGW